MRQVDRLVIKEMIGPWVFGVAMFSSLLMAATYLNKIAEYVVRGLSPALLLKIIILLMPAILAKTFAMAMLLSALLAFGRLSSDSEIIAMRAAGASIPRIVRPVMAFALVIAIITFFFNDQVVPPAAAKSRALVMSIDSRGQANKGEPVSIPIHEEGTGRIQAQLVAQEMDLLHSKLHNVTIIAYDKDGKKTFYLDCAEMEYHGKENWTISNGATLIPASGGRIIKVSEAWPANIPKLNKSIDDIDAASNSELDDYSMAETKHKIEMGRRDGSLKPKTIHNLEYGYWNKISVALAAFVFGTLGAVLGIRNQRTGSATGFAMAIGIIFGYFTLANFMNVWALSGVLPAWAASFAPILIGLIIAGFVMWRRNS